MLRAITIGKRLSIAFTLMILFSILVGGLGLQGLSKVDANIANLTDRRIPATALVAEMTRDFLMVRLSTVAMLVPGTDNDKFLKIQQDSIAAYTKSETAAAALHQSTEGRAVYEKLLEARNAYMALLLPLTDLIKAGKLEEARIARNQGLDEASAGMTQALRDLTDYQTQTAAKQSAHAKDSIKSADLSMMISVVIAALIGAVLSYVTTKSLVNPLQSAVSFSEKVAAGDLTLSLRDDMPDEAGQMVRALTMMQNQLRQTLAQVTSSASQLAATSEELSVVTEQSAKTLHQQSSELEMAATAVTELTAAIEDVARNALETSRNSAQADEEAKGGKARVDAAADSIRTLVDNLAHAQSGMSELVGRVNNIGSVLDVIRAIADQTNLLALNAAIEAARAGESGRGFAVVADEVRALASRTQDSTKEIEAMMKAVQAQTNETVAMITHSTEAAQKTRTDSDAAGQAFMEIATSLEQINDQTMTVASAAEQQATVAREVDRGLLNIRSLADQTAEGAHETQASSAELARLATSMNELVSHFKV